MPAIQRRSFAGNRISSAGKRLRNRAAFSATCVNGINHSKEAGTPAGISMPGGGLSELREWAETDGGDCPRIFALGAGRLALFTRRVKPATQLSKENCPPNSGVIRSSFFKRIAGGLLILGCTVVFRLFAADPLPASTASAPLITTLQEFRAHAREWSEGRMVRLSGTVTHSLTDRTFFLQDGDDGVYVFHRPPTAFSVGTRVEVTGRPSLGGFSPTLQDCTAIVLGPGQPPVPRSISAAEGLSRSTDMILVRLQGLLSAVGTPEANRWILSAAGSTNRFFANLDSVTQRDALAEISAGSLLELTGVCGVRLGPDRQPSHFVIFLRSAADVRLIKGPPWWTSGRILVAALGGLALALLWAWGLRQRVAQKTTELRRQLTETSALEHRYRLLFETNPHPMWVHDQKDFRILAVNRAAIQHYGYSQEEFQRLALRDIQPQTGDQTPEVPSEITSKSWMAARHRKRNGEFIDVEMFVETLEFAGHAAAMVLAQDITARKAAEADLARSQEWFGIIFRTCPDGILVVRLKDERILNLNPAFERLTGIPASEAIGRTTTELNFWVDSHLRANSLQQLRDRRSVTNIEMRLRRREGSELTVLLSAEMVDFSGEDCILSLVRDITERQRASLALRRSEANLAAAQHIASLGSWELDLTNLEQPDSNPLAWSNEVFRIFGYAPGEIEVTNDNFFRAVHPDDRDRVRATMAQALKSRKPYRLEHRIIRPDGNVRIVEEYSELSFDAVTGKPVRMAGVVQDITLRRAAEEERRNFELKLQQAQKLESLGVLAGGIAHDFNNLLTAVMGNLSLAQLDLSPASPALGPMREAERATQRAADLARQMLAYSGKGRFVVQRVQLSDVVKEMTQMLQVSASKKAALRFTFTAQMPPVEVDITQLRQIILNLVTNASDAIGDQNGIITLSTGVMNCDRAYLESTWLDDPVPEGLYAYLEVADTGCGISREQLPRIFDPFFTTKFTGRGLGLAAVLGIVRGHRGALKVYSEVGRGTTFKILLPVSGAAADAPDQKPASATWTGSGLVLLVDDEESIRGIGQRLLERLGFTVVVAADGHQALELVRAHGSQLACVLLDLTMPQMDGEETFRELRRLQTEVPVVLSSGYSEQDIAQRFVGKGLAGFVPKPYSLDGLQTVLRKVVAPKTGGIGA